MSVQVQVSGETGLHWHTTRYKVHSYTVVNTSTRCLAHNVTHSISLLSSFALRAYKDSNICTILILWITAHHLCNAHVWQGVVTTMCPVLPPVTAIKKFDHQNEGLIVWFIPWSLLAMITWSTFSSILIAWFLAVNGCVYKHIWSAIPIYRYWVVCGIKMSIKSPSQMEVQGTLWWLPLVWAHI